MFAEPLPRAYALSLPPLRCVDGWLSAALLFLLGFGLLVLYSVSQAPGIAAREEFFARQLLHAGAALTVFALALCAPLRFWQDNTLAVLALSLLLCLFALFFEPTKGAARWIKIFGLSFQASELLKFATLLTYAYWGALVIKNNTLGAARLKDIFRPAIPLGVFLFFAAAILVLQKDLGTIVLLAGIALLALVLADMAWKHIFLIALLLLLFTVVLVLAEPYRIDRVRAFADVFEAPYGRGYAQLQSLMAYANGGWWGVGAGGSFQKALLPEAHNDFILAVLAEEYGLVGFFAVCAAYLLAAVRILQVGNCANARGEIFGAFYAYTLSALLLLQAAINIGGSLAVLPSKGITLPLVSYGGSSLLACAVMLGALYRLHYENILAAQADGGGARRPRAW